MNQKITLEFVKEQEKNLIITLFNYESHMEETGADAWADQICESVEYYFDNCKLLGIQPNPSINYV